jgi:hypothetical protein
LGTDAELPEHRAEVIPHRARAQEHRSGDGGHPIAFHQHPDDVKLAGGELFESGNGGTVSY